MRLDKELGAVLITVGHKELYYLLEEHYRLRKSKSRIAEELYEKHHDWCIMTCIR
ncbi:DUF1133 family protein [Klebsiella pneumoniae]|uniref:DUF1133 family protein n=1 Tax=Klebsiella pneumoniae TaxID=573 RepID=UPI002731673F|nr:DUF1133 family protein [Klebsiella pneumoniae]MDP0897034.1 DUF1133 family protein [Klebsiella pneumoniae]